MGTLPASPINSRAGGQFHTRNPNWLAASSASSAAPQRLAYRDREPARLARALALDPPLLFLDEPTAGLDPIGAAAFDHLTRTLQQALGLTVFLITHDLDTLYTICNRVAVLADGKVLVNAPLEEVEKYDHPWVQEYFHGPRGRARRHRDQQRQRARFRLQPSAFSLRGWMLRARKSA